MKDLVTTIAQALVNNPEQVSVNEIIGEHTIIFELEVAREDIGQVIGKNGQTAVAIRTILNAAAGKLKKNIKLDIVE